MNEVKSSSALRRFFLILGVLVALVLIVIGIRHATRDEVFVVTGQASMGDIVSSVSTNGKVEPMELFQAHAEAPGQVQSVYVKAGSQVSKGTLLLKLDTADKAARVQAALSAVATANATAHDIRQGGSQEEQIGLRGDLDRAKLQVDQAEQNLQALQQLQSHGAASPSEVNAARERLLTAQSSLKSLEQRGTDRYAATDLQRASALLKDSHATLAAAQHELANSVIRTPIAGTVFSLPVRPYDFVQTGDELVQVADLSRMQVRAYFDEPEIGRLHQGDLVTITWDAKAGRIWHGHIVRVPTTVITYGTRNVGECLIAVDDATGDLLPSTNINAKVTTQQLRGVLTIPREALRTQNSFDFVYVLRKGKLQKTPVEVGSLNLLKVQIKSGLKPGDVVALHSTSNVDLSDGLEVTETK